MNHPFPSIEAVLAFLRDANGRGRKRDVAEAFGLRGAAKQKMKALLRDLRRDGRLEKTDGKRLKPKSPRVERAVRVPFGIFRRNDAGGGHLYAVDRRDGHPFVVEPGADLPEDGAAVRIESVLMPRFAPATAKLGAALPFNLRTPHVMSLITLHEFNLPQHFDPAIEAAAATAPFPTLHGRDDLRDIPFTVIDPVDARDHDDAVWAESEGDGMRLHVAIADVAFYVAAGSVIDAEARRRGNSVYLPDRAVPMLPERLSSQLCSLLPDKDRAAVVVTLQLDAQGRRVGAVRVRRALVRAARLLDYDTAQTAPGLDPLWEAHRLLELERARRQPLALESTEFALQLTDEGRVTSIAPRPTCDTHRLIENFMIAANVAVAELLASVGASIPYRVHDAPPLDKLKQLREKAVRAGLPFEKTQSVTPAAFNALLAAAADTPFADVLQTEVLRSQTQASYDTLNIGHFGLALPRYTHFTSPIRRYADLCVHRALLRHLGFEAPDGDDVATLCRHLNTCERKAVEAERACWARYGASFYAERVGEVFQAVITGVGPAGAFLRLRDTGVDGFLPIHALPGFLFDDKRGGRLSCGKQRIASGDLLSVRLAYAVPPAGCLRFEPAEMLAPERSAPSKKPHKRDKRKRA